MNQRLERIERQRKIWELMKATGKTTDLRHIFNFQWGNSPLSNGKPALRYQNKEENSLELIKIAQDIAGGPPVDFPTVDPQRAVLIGHELSTGRPVAVNPNVFTTHGLIFGGSGAGKTTILMRILCVLVRRLRIRAIVNDHKGEGRRLLPLLGDQVIAFRPDQEPVNWLEPVGHDDAYNWGFSSELARAYNLRPETWTELPGILKRIYASRKPGEPHRSLKDFELVLKHLSVVEGRHKLDTAAGAVAQLNHLLGRTASIRKAPDIDDRYMVIVYEHLGLPPRIHSFLTGMRLLRLQLKSTAEGISQGELKRLIVGDETLLESPLDAAISAGAQMGAYERLVVISRYLNVGFLGAAQALSPLPDLIKSNITTVICLRCSNPREAREAAAMLGLPEERAQELLYLPVGQGFVRSVGFGGAVKFAAENFPLGAYLGNAEVEQRLAPERRWLADHTIFSSADSGTTVPLNVAEILGEQVTPVPAEEPVVVDAATRAQFLEDHRTFLREIHNHTADAVTTHYRRLKWSVGKANRIKNELLKMSLIYVERQSSANGRPIEILLLTEAGKELLNENTN